MNYLSSITNGQAVPVIGNVLTKTVTGMIRIPALLANLAAISMVAEGALRVGRNVLGVVGIRAEKDNVLERIANKVDAFGIRPYKAYDNRKLIINAIAMTALSIVAIELVRILGGAPSSAYNVGLGLMGPFRLSENSYLKDAPAILKSLKVIS